MEQHSPRKLWDAFRSVLRDANTVPLDAPLFDYESLARNVRERVMTAPPRNLRAVRSDNDGPILDTWETLVIKTPTIRGTLVSRFGQGTPFRDLKGLFEFEQDGGVRVSIVHAMGHRLNVLVDRPFEAQDIVAFGGELVRGTFNEGREPEVGRAALDFVRKNRCRDIPEVLTRDHPTLYITDKIGKLSVEDRRGMIRFIGDLLPAARIIDLLEAESDPETNVLLLEGLKLNWNFGVAPDNYGTEVDRSRVSDRLSQVVLKKLGFKPHQIKSPAEMAKHLVITPAYPGEHRVFRLMREVAIRALRELSGD